MASLNSIFDSVGRATSTPRVNVNPSQGARSKLLSRSRQSTSPPVERVSESEREHINTQISPSAEPFRQSRWGRRIKPPVVYSP